MGCLRVPAGGRNGKAFWAIFINNGLKPLGNFRHRLLIGNCFPLVLTPRAHALQWRANPIRVIMNTRRRNAFKTNVACKHRVVVGDDPRDLAPFGFRPKLAADITNGAHRVFGFLAH